MIKRRYILGDEWVYYIIYGSPKGVDTIIADHLPSIISYLLQNRLIDKWFFVRYDLPEFHLRLRFHSMDDKSIAKIILSLRPHMEQILSSKLSYKIEAGMYDREIERYGNSTIELIEEIFCHDSEFTMNFLQYLTNNDCDQDMRWLTGLFCIDQCLKNFELTSEKKYQIIKNMRNSFWKEFGLGRDTKKQVDKEYRTKTAKINTYLSAWNNQGLEHNLLVELMKHRNNKLEVLARKINEINTSHKLEIDLEYLLTSIIHMTMNRIFISKNRMNEAICYDFLERL